MQYKSKGAYVKKLNVLDNDLPIINSAIVNFLLKNISVENTINNCNELIEFQKIVKISSNYKYAILGHWTGRGKNKKFTGEKLKDKTFRIFASKYSKNGIFKVNDRNPEKFADTADNIFIDNSDIRDKNIPEELDKNWYINLAKKRLKEKFGING